MRAAILGTVDSVNGHRPLGDLVCQRLRDAIIDGRLQPGQWLRQEALAQELGISQMPVRDALKRLVAEGLAERIPYRGVRVISFSPEDVLDMFTVRMVLESLAVRYATGRITEEELRNYFLYGKNVKKWSRSTSTVALCGIKFFYEHTIKRNWPTLLFIRPGHEKKLPVVLSRDEVRAILSNLELLRYRVCLTTIYACGLRISEGINLRIEHIDSARGFIHVQGSKGKMGKKDRYVPLPKKTLQLLRQQWPPARRAYASERNATETKSCYSLLPATAAKTCPTPQGRSA